MRMTITGVTARSVLMNCMKCMAMIWKLIITTIAYAKYLGVGCLRIPNDIFQKKYCDIEHICEIMYIFDSEFEICSFN